MQNIIYKSILGVLAVTAIVSCKPDLKTPTPSAGSVDVSKYVSIGNSITSGYADGALYYDGQMVSYPNLLAEQFKLVGGGEFKQPLVSMSSVGLGSALNSRYTLNYKTDCSGVTALSPITGNGDFGVFANIATQGPFNNMGVPGAKSFHVPFAGYGTANPYFGRFASSASASMLSDAAAQKPTFFSLFIGNNDVLSYALAGGASDSITAPGIFNFSIDAIVNTMMAAGAAKGIIGNIPDVTALPYFTTIPYNSVVLDGNSAAQLNGYYNLAYPGSNISFVAGANAFVIKDPTAPAGVRKMKANECVLLSIPQDSIKCAKWGSQKPLANQYVLTETEIAAIQNAVASFNSKLRSTADIKGLAFVDVSAFMTEAKKGIVFNGVTTSATFVSGGAFSLDGVHLTPKGNALLANEFIMAVNSKYGSSIPLLDPGKYRGVVFPN